MKILNVAYPLIPVRADAAGGTEQVLYQLLHGLAQPPYSRELELTTVAHRESQVPGRLIGVDPPPATVVDDRFQTLSNEQNRQVLELLARERFTLIHNQGGSFYRCANQTMLPVLFTIHLARSLYPADFLQIIPSNLFLQCVSRTQHAEYERDLSPQLRRNLAGWISNGIDVEGFRFEPKKQSYFVYVGRICYEKGPHVAIDIAKHSRRRLVIIGAVYPFGAHQEYFRGEIEPRLGDDVQWIETPSLEHKREVLAKAAAVLIPSLVDETSSLVAMEAAASGTPVLAFDRGALPEIIRDSETGYLADDAEGLLARVNDLPRIDPRRCREIAQQEFSAARMVGQYFELYRKLARVGEPREQL